MDSAGIGEANRMADEGVGMGPLVKRTLPNRVNINVPVNGVESQLLGVIEGTNPAGRTTWLDFDRLTFDSGSSVLRVNSSEQLDNVAAILKAYPNVKLLLTGYTDSVGNPATNMALSRARAEAVKNELVFRGIAPDRLTTKGYGEQSSTADNSTAGGRARNRRVSLQVTQK
jgi:K(+)-stimulated pyrophosphate-energized sodium pump